MISVIRKLFGNWKKTSKLVGFVLVGMIAGSLLTGQAQAFVFGSQRQVSQWVQAGANLIGLRNETNNLRIGSSGALYIDTAAGRVGIGTISPAAALHLKAGTNSANTAPLKLTAGSNLDTAEAGAMEFDGTNLYFTPAALRKTIAFTDSNITGNAATATNLVGLTATITNLNSVTGLLGTAAFTASVDYATAAQGTLASNALPASSFTDAAVTGKLITGYSSDAGTVVATDTILQTINKLNGNTELKAPIASPTFTGTVSGITAAMVGLGNVTNESKATMFASPTFTGTVTIPTPFTLGATSVTASGAELNILDGVTATAAELNKLDGVTATATELNYTDGVTSAIQTQMDLKAPLASPTFTGTITTPSPPIVAAITSATSGAINLPQVTVPYGSFATFLHGSTFETSKGYIDHISIGDYRDRDYNWGSIFFGIGGNDSYPTSYFLMRNDGVFSHSSGGLNIGGTLTMSSPFTLGATSVTASGAELNILDGVTATAAELNKLDGVTATATELNYTDGVTSAIQTQMDLKAPLASPTFTGDVTMPGTGSWNSLGNVGIGIAVPGEALEVNGNIITTNNRSLPHIVLDSTSSGDNWTAQGAYISIGESGNLGSASMHSTYTGDGYGYSGAGTVTAGIPAGGYWKYTYNSQIISTPASVSVGSLTLGGTAITATATELNLLDGVTATTAELNILDGVTATATELNYTDGVTSAIQTQMDLKAPLASPTFTGNVTMPGTGIWNSSGNVGVGTTSPGHKLEVSGHLKVTGNAFQDYTTFKASGTGLKWVRISYSGQNGGALPVHLYITRAITDDSRSPYGGPSLDLKCMGNEWHVGQQYCTAQYGYHGSTGAEITHAAIRNNSSGGYYVYLRLYGSVTYKVWTAVDSDTSTGAPEDSATGAPSVTDAYALVTGFNIIGDTTPNLYVAGNVGIGMTTPSQKLQIDSGNAIIRGLNNYASSGDTARLYLGDTNAYIGAKNGTGLQFGTFTSSDMVTFQQGTGNVGIGTTTPNQKLHVSGGAGSANLLIEADTDNSNEADQPSLVLSQDGGAVLGTLGYVASENALSLYNQWGDSLQLGTNNNRQMMVINSSGSFGIGTTDPGAIGSKVAIQNNTDGVNRILTAMIPNLSGTAWFGLGRAASTYDSGWIGFTNAGGTGSQSNYFTFALFGVGDILNLTGYGRVGVGIVNPSYQFQVSTDSAGKPNGGSWANSSDMRLKTNIATMSGALDKLTRLRGVNFNWKNQDEHLHEQGLQGGFIAQEVETVFPNWVKEVDGIGKDGILTGGKTKSLSLPFEFDALLVEAIKEQQGQIEDLKLSLNNLGLINSTSTMANLSNAADPLQWLTNGLQTLGMTLRDGIASLKEVVAAKFTGDEANIGKVQTEQMTARQMCVAGVDGETVCLTKDQLKDLIARAGSSVTMSKTYETPASDATSTDSGQE